MCIVVDDDDVGLNVLGCRCIVVVVVDHFHMAPLLRSRADSLRLHVILHE